MKKFCILIISILLSLIGLVGCNEVDLVIECNKELELGFSEELNIKYMGNDFDVNQFYWSSSDTDVVNIYENTIIPFKEGEATIKAVMKNDPSIFATIDVTVAKALIDGIKIRGINYMFVGDEESLDFYTVPNDIAVNVKWSSSNSDVVEIDESGYVKAKAVGSAEIKLESGKASDTILIQVDSELTEIKSNINEQMSIGQTTDLKFNISDPVITVEKNGSVQLLGDTLFAKAEGEATVKVTSKSKSNLSKEYKITVVNNSNTYKAFDNKLEEYNVNNILNQLTLEQKVGQLLFAEFYATNLSEDENGAFFVRTQSGGISKTYVDDLIGIRAFNNLSISVDAYSFTPGDAEDAIINATAIQNFVMNTSSIGGFTMYSSDYTSGSFMKDLEKICLGNIDDEESVKTYYKSYFKELKDMGINVYITDAYAINKGYSNYYFDDVVKNAYYSYIMRSSAKSNGILLGARYNPNYYETKENQLANLNLIVNGGVDMIVLYNEVSNFANEKSLVQYIRQDLNYDGIIYIENSIDYASYNGVFEPVSENSVVNYVINSIKNGVNGFDCQLYINTNSYGSGNDIALNAYDSLVNYFKQNPNDVEALNKAVSNIIAKKYQYNIVNGSYPTKDKSVDYSKDYQFVQSLYKKIYFVSEGYVPFTKDDNVYVMSTSTYTGWGQSRVTYDFAKSFASFAKGKGINVKGTFTLNSTKYPSFLEGIGENDKLIIAMSEDGYSFREKVEKVEIIDGEEHITTVNEWKWVDWYEVIEEALKYTSNITVVLIKDTDINYYIDDISQYVLAYGVYDSSYAALMEKTINGK